MNTRGNRRKAYDLSDGTALGRFRRSFAAWAGLLLLVFNLAAGAGLSSYGMPQGADGTQVVCTSTGMVVQNRDGQPVKDSAAAEFCFLCLPLLHGARATSLHHSISVSLKRHALAPDAAFGQYANAFRARSILADDS